MEVYNFKANRDGIFKINENGEENKISEFINVKEIKNNIDDGSYKSLIEFKAFEEFSEITLPRSTYLNVSSLMNLQDLGMDIRYDNRKDVVDYLRKSEESVVIKKVHTKLGFSEFHGKVIYKLFNCIGIDSEYDGQYEIKPTGNREEYINMLKNEIFGKCELEFIVICALSAVLLGYLGKDLNLDSLIIHLVGNSTTGKSTALKLAISLFGYPDSKGNGLYNTYYGTNNAIIKKLTNLNGVPFALDEISMSNTQNFTKLIYSFANGTDKERLDKESQLKEKETWLTTILSNGEKSLVGSSNKNAGIHVRVIEASNIVWTKDAQNSQNINQIILKNYGFIGFEFAKYIMDIGKTKLMEEYKKLNKMLYERMDKELILDTMAKRKCNNYTVLLQAAYNFERMMKIKLDIEEIIKMIINIEKESLKERNFKNSAIEYIKDYVSKYRNKFDNGINSPSDNLGKITKKENYIEIQMNKISFQEMLKLGGFEDKAVVLKELKDAGFLDCEKDRFTRTRKNTTGYNEEVYVIKLNN